MMKGHDQTEGGMEREGEREGEREEREGGGERGEMERKRQMVGRVRWQIEEGGEERGDGEGRRGK